MTCGAVCMNLTIAANALGFPTVWLSEWYAYDTAVLALLGLTPSEKIAGFIHIGRPPAPREDRLRPVIADIVTRFADSKRSIRRCAETKTSDVGLELCRRY